MIDDAQEERSEEYYDTYRYVLMKESNEFMMAKEMTSNIIAYGVFLCIISPICLFILGAMSEGDYGIGENVVGFIGLIVALIIISIAVSLFIYSASKTSKYEYLVKEVFETKYGVSGMVKERQESFKV